MSLPQFFMILRARFWVVAAALVMTVGAVVAASLVLPKKYTATAAVVADVTSPDPISGAATHAMVMPGYMATQRDIITSERVAQRVKHLLQAGMPTAQLRSRLDVKPSRESNVIEIGYSSPDPRFAAAAANAFAQAYIEASIELRVDPARQYARWFGEQDKALRENLAQAQRNLSEHQQKYGILASDEKLDVETNRLNDLTAQLTALQSQLSESRGRQRSGAAATSLPDVVQNPLIHTLKSEIARQEAKLNEASGNLGRNHPQYQQMESELAALRLRLESEMRVITRGHGTAIAVGRDKEADLAAAIAAQRKRVLAVRQARDQLAALQRELDFAQKAYEGVAQRHTQSRLESQFRQTNVSVLSLAAEPSEPSFPNLMLNTVAALFLGTLLGVAAALGLEILDRRVRSPRDVVEMLELPMLGVIPRRRVRALPLPLLR